MFRFAIPLYFTVNLRAIFARGRAVLSVDGGFFSFILFCYVDDVDSSFFFSKKVNKCQWLFRYFLFYLFYS